MNFRAIITSLLLCWACTGCALLKSDRVNLPPPEPRLDAKQLEVMQEQAKANYDLAKWIRTNGVKPNEERAILLEDGTKILVKFFGQPYKEVDGTDIKQDKHLNNKAEDVVIDYRKDVAEHRDEVYENREKAISKANSKWDIWKILGFFTSAWFLVGVGLLVSACFFPVIWPVLQIFWQISKMGFGAFKVVAGLGLHGILNILKALEAFRNIHKDTPVGQALDTHLSASLDAKTKTALDALKNHFDI